MHKFEVETTQNVGISYPTASLVERLFAFSIDQIILFAYSIIVTLLVDTIAQVSYTGLSNLKMLLILPIYFLYNLLFEFFNNGQTLGKKIRNIKVMKLDGSRPSLGSYFSRWLFSLLEFYLFLGAPATLSIMFTNKSQRIGDILSGTTVVKNEPLVYKKHLVDQEFPKNYELVFPKASFLNRKQAELINTVLTNWNISTKNNQIVLLAEKVKEALQITDNTNLSPKDFLEQLLRDYAYIYWEEENKGQVTQLQQGIDKLLEAKSQIS